MKIFILLFAILYCTRSQPFTYGIHQPQGVLSVDYLYSTSGTWKPMSNIEYVWNYYNYSDNPKTHPYDRDALIKYADGTHLTTCRDANKHLLLDYNHDGEIDVSDAGYAFHEHNGRGVNNTQQGTPFTNFWFDDNDLASVLSEAYGKDIPQGLSTYKDFTRWRIMTGNHTNWTPYGSSEYIDQAGLDGLYHIAMKQKAAADLAFNYCLIISNATYDKQLLQYNYRIGQNYKLGLMAVLASFMYEYAGNQTYLQHYVSLRSNLLSKLQRDPSNGSNAFSWMVFNNSDPGNLFNTQTMTLGSLGLSAGASFVFEASSYPCDPSFPDNPTTHLRSGVLSQSEAGYLLRDILFPADPTVNYTVEFVLRGYPSNASGIVLKLEVGTVDGSSTNTKLVRQQDLKEGLWTGIRVDFRGQGQWNFDVYWTALSSVDLSIIRVRKTGTLQPNKKTQQKTKKETALSAILKKIILKKNNGN